MGADLSPTGSQNIFKMVLAWLKTVVTKVVDLIFHRKETLAPKTDGHCGNSLCEPEMDETKDNCPQDCTPSF